MRAFAEALEAFGQEATSQAESLTLPPAVSTPDLLLVLRLEGTPVVYRPAPGQQVITLGRQIRKLGAGYSQGNDLVLRVPNNPQLSLRISRRHLEIRRQGEEYVAIDRSKGGTSCNGQPLAPNVPWPLRDGDRLVVAGLITLGVSLTGPRGVRPTLRQVQVPTSAPEGGKALLEVSLGDLVTVE
jgi:pSer/pThr/pTyr-binding forkhead associated (FHA) protein